MSISFSIITSDYFIGFVLGISGLFGCINTKANFVYINPKPKGYKGVTGSER
jgi:hypothetical protein